MSQNKYIIGGDGFLKEIQQQYYTNDIGRVYQKDYNIMLECINDLPNKFKEVITARELQGWDYELIAEKHNISLQLVKNRIKKGREILIKKYNHKKLKKLNEIY